MSRIHVRFVNRRVVDGKAVYSVESIESKDSPLVGEVRIDIATYEYDFIPLGPLEGKRLIPSKVFDLPESEQNKVIERDYPYSEFGGLILRISRMVHQLRERRELPEELYGVT